MIRRIVDFALNSCFLVLALAILLFAWGVISFKNLPIEAYPDVANNYVQVITQWPRRAAAEVEQQDTIPIEIAMNGIGVHLRQRLQRRQREIHRKDDRQQFREIVKRPAVELQELVQ